MKIVRLMFLSAAFVAGGMYLSACDPKSDSEQTAAENPAAEQAKKAAEVANKIAANPDNATKILSDAGWTEADFKNLLYEIAADTELSNIYTQNRN